MTIFNNTGWSQITGHYIPRAKMMRCRICYVIDVCCVHTVFVSTEKRTDLEVSKSEFGVSITTISGNPGQ